MAFVLKSQSQAAKGAAAREVTGLAGFNLADLADEGRVRIDQCRAQVQQMIEQAKQQAESIRKQADERGYQEGLKRAAVDADQKLKAEAEVRARDGLQLIGQAVARLHETHQQWMRQYADSLTQIALSAAEKIVLHRLESEPEILVRWADEALQSTRAATSLTVVVHPETLATLGDELDQLLAAPGLPEQTHIEPDESVDRNAVFVRQNGGDIDAGLSAQLGRLEELLS